MSLVKSISRVFVRNAPKICIYLGIFGFTKTVVDTAITAPKIKQKIEDYKKEMNKDKLTLKETIKVTYKDVLPIALQASLSTCLIIAGDVTHTQRSAAFASAYLATTQSFNNYKDVVKEKLTEKQFQEVEQKVAQDKIDKNPVGKNSIIITGKGDYLCYEPLSGQYFRSTWDQIHETYLNLLDNGFQGNGELGFDDWLYSLGLNVSKFDCQKSWNLSDGKANWPNIYATSTVAENNEPAICIGYGTEPKLKY